MTEVTAAQEGDTAQLGRGVDGWFSRHGGLTVLGVAGLSVIAVVLISLIWWDWVRSAEVSTSATLRNLGLLAAVLPTVTLAVWRNSVGNHQAASAQRQAEVALRGHLNERYRQGVELLASDSMMTRLGGIHALQNLALESPGEHSPQIVQLLCAFARHPPPDPAHVDPRHSSTPAPDEDEFDAASTSSRVREDVLTCIKAAANCVEKTMQELSELELRLDLRSADLQGYDLSQVNLRGAVLVGAQLQRSILRQANLSDADLSHASLEGANLADSRLERSRLDYTNFDQADLGQACLNDAQSEKGRWEGAQMVRAQLRGFKGSMVNMHSARPHYADLTGATLSSSDLRNTDFEYAKLIKAELTASQVSRAHFYGADFEGAHMAAIDGERASFSRAKLRNAVLSSAALIECRFENADLSSSRANDVHLTNSDLSRSDLTGTDLRKAWLHGCLLYEAQLDETVLTEAKMGAGGYAAPEYVDNPEGAAVQGLTQQQLDAALAAPEHPPELDGAVDAQTGEQLAWQGGEAN